MDPGAFTSLFSICRIASAFMRRCGRLTLSWGGNAQPPQQSFQKAREEIAFEGLVGCHPYYDKWSNLGVSQRFTAQHLAYPALVVCNPQRKLPDQILCLLLRLQLLEMELNEFLHLLSGRIQVSQWESQLQLGYLLVFVESHLDCGILGGKSCASLGC